MARGLPAAGEAAVQGRSHPQLPQAGLGLSTTPILEGGDLPCRRRGTPARPGSGSWRQGGAAPDWPAWRALRCLGVRGVCRADNRPAAGGGGGGEALAPPIARLRRLRGGRGGKGGEGRIGRGGRAGSAAASGSAPAARPEGRRRGASARLLLRFLLRRRRARPATPAPPRAPHRPQLGKRRRRRPPVAGPASPRRGPPGWGRGGLSPQAAFGGGGASFQRGASALACRPHYLLFGWARKTPRRPARAAPLEEMLARAAGSRPSALARAGRAWAPLVAAALGRCAASLGRRGPGARWGLPAGPEPSLPLPSPAASRVPRLSLAAAAHHRRGPPARAARP